uniref:Uncharacterized protein n=1 Tax=Opuntia streptacantha TaxID=393608 RepID=A0A7C8YAS4_OPUST
MYQMSYAIYSIYGRNSRGSRACGGATGFGGAEGCQKFKVDNSKTFHYLNQCSYYNVDAMDDAKKYLAARKAMDVVGIGPDGQSCGCNSPVGNIELTKGGESDSSESKDDESRFHMKTAAESNKEQRKKWDEKNQEAIAEDVNKLHDFAEDGKIEAETKMTGILSLGALQPW